MGRSKRHNLLRICLNLAEVQWQGTRFPLRNGRSPERFWYCLGHQDCLRVLFDMFGSGEDGHERFTEYFRRDIADRNLEITADEPGGEADDPEGGNGLGHPSHNAPHLRQDAPG